MSKKRWIKKNLKRGEFVFLWGRSQKNFLSFAEKYANSFDFFISRRQLFLKKLLIKSLNNQFSARRHPWIFLWVDAALLSYKLVRKWKVLRRQNQAMISAKDPNSQKPARTQNPSAISATSLPPKPVRSPKSRPNSQTPKINILRARTLSWTLSYM